MVFELITGDYLFDPREDSKQRYSRDEDHLALISELCGPYPKHLTRFGKYHSVFFNDNCKLKKIRTLDYWPLSDVLHEKYKMHITKAKSLSSFLMKMLTINPSARASASEMMDHPWLIITDDDKSACFEAEHRWYVSDGKPTHDTNAYSPVIEHESSDSSSGDVLSENESERERDPSPDTRQMRRCYSAPAPTYHRYGVKWYAQFEEITNHNEICQQFIRLNIEKKKMNEMHSLESTDDDDDEGDEEMIEITHDISDNTHFDFNFDKMQLTFDGNNNEIEHKKNRTFILNENVDGFSFDLFNNDVYDAEDENEHENSEQEISEQVNDDKIPINKYLFNEESKDECTHAHTNVNDNESKMYEMQTNNISVSECMSAVNSSQYSSMTTTPTAVDRYMKIRHSNENSELLAALRELPASPVSDGNVNGVDVNGNGTHASEASVTSIDAWIADCSKRKTHQRQTSQSSTFDID